MKHEKLKNSLLVPSQEQIVKCCHWTLSTHCLLVALGLAVQSLLPTVKIYFVFTKIL